MKIFHRSLLLMSLAVAALLTGCGSPSPSKTVEKWNSLIESGQTDQAFSLFANGAMIVDSASPTAQIRGDAIKAELVRQAGELKKNKDAGKPAPVFMIGREDVNGDHALVVTSYKVGEYPQGRNDFHMVMQDGVWKIEKMDGRGFIFR